MLERYLAGPYAVKYLDVDRIVTIGIRPGEYDYIWNVQDKIYHAFGNLTELLPKNQILRLSDNGEPLIYSAIFLSYKDRIDNNQAIITVQSINADASADNITSDGYPIGNEDYQPTAEFENKKLKFQCLFEKRRRENKIIFYFNYLITSRRQTADIQSVIFDVVSIELNTIVTL
ncbi:unnamed protein product [Didymodactylos carnosus]|uniref:Uncharacterized protein n=1 Tax=Didymodactylos carnosus TaxID=1234261 RepID=A0A815IE25_9BILA|nr:unnamed protein product [Didymodactylos carnosus]CAF4242466.1 unnamed protein product [Didymodactylos carnosus]